MDDDLETTMSDAGSVSGASDRSMDSTASSPAPGDTGGDSVANKSIADSSSSLGGGGGSGGSGSSKPRVQLPASCGPPRPGSPTVPLVWIVFGGTGHIGRSVVKSAIAHGDYVTMVGRTFETTPAAMLAMAIAAAEQATGLAVAGAVGAAGAAGGAGGANRAAIESPCLGALCDVRSRESVNRVVRRTLDRFGRVDVIANCSGYGVVGACEDQDEHELRNQFETNFMGTLHILQATIPVLRRQYEQDRQKRKQQQQQQQQQQHYHHHHHHHHHRQEPQGGRYLIFSSTSGALGVPGLGPYCATKYAVEGLIEAMQYEVDPFNIKATLVEPGYVRRDDHYQPRQQQQQQQQQQHWSGRPMSSSSMSTSHTEAANTTTTAAAAAAAAATAAANSPLPTWGHFLIKPPSEPYANASSPALHATRLVQWLGDRQPTSVVQCAELVWQLAHCSFPPLRLPLGSYAIESIRDRLRSVTEELEDWKHLNFPVPPDAAAAAAGAAGAVTATTACPGEGADSKAAEIEAADAKMRSEADMINQDEDMEDAGPLQND